MDEPEIAKLGPDFSCIISIGLYVSTIVKKNLKLFLVQGKCRISSMEMELGFYDSFKDSGPVSLWPWFCLYCHALSSVT